MVKASTNTTSKSDVLAEALGNVSEKFRNKIIDVYIEIKHRLIKSLYNKEYDALGLSSGKFCETVFRFIEHELKGVSIPFNQPIPNLTSELAKLMQLPSTSGSESLRIIIPRAIAVIYTLRNKRGIGHVGGDIEANEVDASTIVKLIDWIMVELIRIYHSLSFEEAQGIVDSINTKAIPAIWEINGKKRVLQKGLGYKDKVLLLVYSDTNNGVAVEDLFGWTEYSSLSMFKSKLLKSMHRDNLIEYDTELEFVHLSPLGIMEVEGRIIG